MATIPLIAILLFLHQPLASSLTDADALLRLKSSFLNADTALSSWISPSVPSFDEDDSTPCTNAWIGVLCFEGIITSLRLGGLGLAGTIDVAALSHFRALRSISFINNNLTGSLPDIGRLDALKSVYLSNNHFSGTINGSFFSSMDHLKKLWLDGNDLSGKIPSSLSKATSLIELRLEGNDFTGVIPALKLPSLRSFNVSNNNLQGPIPASLAHYDASAFAGNAKLCGPPLPGPPCPILNSTDLSTVSQLPLPVPVTKSNSHAGQGVLLVLGMLFLILALVIGYAAVKTHGQADYAESTTDDRDAAAMAEAMAAAAAASPVYLPASASSRSQGKQPHSSGVPKRGRSSRGGGGGSGAELVMINDEKGVFGLPDLMTAAAEVLGNGGLGSVYKAVMANGVAVAVKRMRDLNRLNKEGFDREMRRLGWLRHSNVLTPLAYHFRKEEKLIISEYIPKGSLLYILHGDRAADQEAVGWATRLKIIRGIARGMAYLHAELATYELPHGNLKTGNILLGPDLEPLVADYGLIALANSTAATALFAHKSPEAPHVSPKSDVYCFGVVILEILTGKFPSHYLNNTKGGTDVVQLAASALADRREADIIDPQITGRAASTSSEMVSLLRLGVACTQADPDERPGMKEAAELVEEIAAAAGDDGGIDAAGPVGPVPTGRDGYAQLSGSLRGSGSRRSEGSGRAAPAQRSGNLFSL